MVRNYFYGFKVPKRYKENRLKIPSYIPISTRRRFDFSTTLFGRQFVLMQTLRIQTQIQMITGHFTFIENIS